MANDLDGPVQAPQISIESYTGILGFREAVSGLDAVADRLSPEVLALAAKTPQLVFVSRSGSTSALVGPLDATTTTTFFGGFEAPDAWETRNRYFLEKLSALMWALEESDVALEQAGVTITARLPVAALERDRCRQALARSLDPGRWLSGDEPPYDFTHRASRRVGEDGFLVTHVSWYQTRNYTFRLQVPQPVAGMAQAQLVLRPWDGVVTAEGVELKLDVNNQQGLLRGRRTWTRDDLAGVLTRGLEQAEATFRRLADRITSELWTQREDVAS